MGIVKYKNPKTGLIYCYESTPIWDSEKGQARPSRVYLGRWDEATQTIIPTAGKRGRKKKSQEDDSIHSSAAHPTESSEPDITPDLLEELMNLRKENKDLRTKNQELVSLIESIHRLTAIEVLK